MSSVGAATPPQSPPRTPRGLKGLAERSNDSPSVQMEIGEGVGDDESSCGCLVICRRACKCCKKKGETGANAGFHDLQGDEQGDEQDATLPAVDMER